MGTQETLRSPEPHEPSPEPHEPHEPHEPPVDEATLDVVLPDGAHLDADAECLEDPVHCGDAQHQHDARTAATPPVDETGQPLT